MKKILITEQQFNNLVNNLLNEDDRENRIIKLKKLFPKIPWNKETSPGNTYEEILIKTDPTEILNYLPWIVRQYNDILKHKITDVSENEFLEDLYKIKDYLGLFDRVKHNLSPEQRNINNYQTYKDLYNIIEPYLEKKDSDLELSKTQQGLQTKKDAEKIYEDNKWLIIWPKTQEASCLYGKGSQWCTAADRSNNMFKSYNSHGIFNYVINKTNQKEKYAFFFDRNTNNVEVYDVNDKNITSQINNFFKTKKVLLKPLIESGKRNYSWKFLISLGYGDWISFVDPQINRLDIDNLNLGKLSDKIGQLSNLSVLNIGENNLKELPENIGNLKNLSYVSLNNNNIRNFPESFGNLKNLQELMLSYNNLTILPQPIRKLPNLKRLYLTGNDKLKNLSKQLKGFPNLRNLEFLSVKSMGLSEKEIKQIKILFPNINIIF